MADLDEIRDEWSELAERTGNLFATWEWNAIWWRHFGRDGRLLAAGCRDARGALVGVLPLYLAAVRPARIIRFLGHGPGDRLGPICSPDDRSLVAESLRRALRSSPFRRALVVAEQLPAEEGWTALLGAPALRRESSPALRIEAKSWEDFLAGQSSSLRKKVRYEERRLEREHGLRYRLVEEAEELPDALDKLFALHGARWGEEGTEAFAGAEGFHREFAACALERGWLRLWFLELQDGPVAAWYGFRFGGSDWHYQSGRDVSWDRYSVGSVLLAHTIRDCIEAGLPEYRFLRGGEAYKQRFANSDPGLETVALPHGVAARAALLAARSALRLPPAARARIARALG